VTCYVTCYWGLGTRSCCLQGWQGVLIVHNVQMFKPAHVVWHAVKACVEAWAQHG
jgi:hypothetical protein